ncbi:MAG TPA: NAD(+) synthase, partial [Candidatus Paceibacterota bacterium]|nr:NAD(+) synthase [Candidatus Paceibacterota bacterium]
CKSQIYSLAKYLNVPEEIQRRTPTSDTYSAPCTQEEFFFRMPFEMHDKLLLLAESGVSPDTAAVELGIPEDSAKRALADIASKRRAAEYLLTPPISLATEADDRSIM